MTTDDQAITDTKAWLERAVIGLNLCPFAKSVHVKGQVHYVVSQATDANGLLLDLKHALNDLLAQAASERDTTLLIAPHCLADFLDFNDFLGRADRTLSKLKLDGVLQIASLHPQYQFADTEPNDVTNFTNRSPYPTLHLLREDSIDRAVAAFPQAEAIFETNIVTMQRLGEVGWRALNVGMGNSTPVGCEHAHGTAASLQAVPDVASSADVENQACPKT